MNILILTGWGYHDYAVAAAATLKTFGNKADVCGVRGILKTYQLKLKIYIN